MVARVLVHVVLALKNRMDHHQMHAATSMSAAYPIHIIRTSGMPAGHSRQPKAVDVLRGL